MSKYKARHKCKGHRWYEFHNGYDAQAGRFWRMKRCLRCSEVQTTLDPTPTTREDG